MTTESVGLPPELQELVEDSQANWVPGPLVGSEFHDSVHRRIRRRNARNSALAACGAVALIAVVLGVTQDNQSSVPGAEQQIAEVAPEPELERILEQRQAVVAIAEGNLPDLSPEEYLGPWFHQALRSNVPLTGLASEYGALGGLYLGESEL
ncbi:MAG: hypothetical protein ACJAYU_003889 [Bradymonadia bacterium]|jgi:hypothetical protein